MIIRDYAGEPRAFRLTLGNVVDLEEACGKVGIGAIYLRVAQQSYRVRDVFEVVRFGLVGGGLDPAAARALVTERFDILPLAEHVNLALDILISLMAGAEDSEPRKTDGDPADPMPWGDIMLQFVKLGMPVSAVRDMDFTDFLALNRAAGRTDADAAPTEEEFQAMLKRFEERYGERH